MSTRFDQRLEAVHDALSLAYQFLLVLDHLDDTNTLDHDAVSVLTRQIEAARVHTRIAAAALPREVAIVELPDDYVGDLRSVGGLPLQPIIDDYRRRFPDEANQRTSDRSSRGSLKTVPRRRKAA